MRPQADLSALGGCNYEIFRGHITDKDDVYNAVKGCDYVIHAAAMTAIHNARFIDFWKVNVEATDNLLEAAKQHEVKRFVYVSTANCFAPGSKDNPGTEANGFLPWLVDSPYAYTKYVAQTTVLNAYKFSRFPSVVVAPAFMLGPRDTKPSSGRLLLYAIKNKVLFYPPGGKSFIDVEKAAAATVNALIHGHLGQAYLLAGENLSYKEFFRLVAEIIHEKKTLLPLPKSLMAMASGTMTIAETLTGRKYNFNRAQQRLLTQENYYSAQKAEKDLGLEKTDLTETVQKAIEWFKYLGMI